MLKTALYSSVLLSLLVSQNSWAAWTISGDMGEGTCTTVTGLDQTIDLGFFNLSTLTNSQVLDDKAKEATIAVSGCPTGLTQAVATFNYTQQNSGFFRGVANTGSGSGILVALLSSDTYGDGSDTILPEGTITANISGGSATIHAWVIPYFSGLLTKRAGTLDSVVNVTMDYN